MKKRTIRTLYQAGPILLSLMLFNTLKIFNEDASGIETHLASCPTGCPYFPGFTVSVFSAAAGLGVMMGTQSPKHVNCEQ
jgi:hypothetical protein